MLSAVWLLPALLSLLGARAITPATEQIGRGLDRIRLRPVAKPFHWFYRRTRHYREEQEWHPEGGRWAHYARLLQKRPILPAVLSLRLVLLLACAGAVAAPGLP